MGPLSGEVGFPGPPTMTYREVANYFTHNPGR
jgi:hypothetical protein